MNLLIKVFDELKIFFGGINPLRNAILYFDGDDPQAPTLNLPPEIAGLGPEIVDLIRSFKARKLGEPGEFGIASQTLQGLLGIQPEQFQLPIQDIQSALAAQQKIEQQRFLQDIRPQLAQRGQLESSFADQLMADFLQQQSSQRLGTTADLLTQQALQNLQTQRALPQFQAGIAGQLAGLGGQRAGIEQFNLTNPFQTVIPAFQKQQQFGLQQAQAQFQADLVPYQQQLQEQQQRNQMFQQLGGLGLSALTGGLGGLFGQIPGISGGGLGAFGSGAFQGLTGFSAMNPLNQLLKQSGGPQVQSSTRFSPTFQPGFSQQPIRLGSPISLRLS